jgi:hypothetical protein
MQQRVRQRTGERRLNEGERHWTLCLTITSRSIASFSPPRSSSARFGDCDRDRNHVDFRDGQNFPVNRSGQSKLRQIQGKSGDVDRWRRRAFQEPDKEKQWDPTAHRNRQFQGVKTGENSNAHQHSKKNCSSDPKRFCATGGGNIDGAGLGSGG